VKCANLEQQLQAAMWVDRTFRFGEHLVDAVSKLETTKIETEQLWQNYLHHVSQHSSGAME
jgi:hypothetical protein